MIIRRRPEPVASSHIITLVAAALVLLPSTPVTASTPLTAEIRATKTAVTPGDVLDLNASPWSTAPTFDKFEDFTTLRPAMVDTVAKLLYDDKNVYVAFLSHQKGIPITATQTVNDVGFGLDDEVTVAIDTSGDGRRVYAFTSTPTGVRYESSTESARYQPSWSASGRIISDGYVVTMTIPLADMRVAATATQTWRINFTRRIAATGDLLTWAYDPSANALCLLASQNPVLYCDANHWPRLVDVRLRNVAKAPPPYADVYALESAGENSRSFETTPLSFTTQATRNFGLDATIPFTRSLSLVGALGPDFSNVETDQTTIAPQEFARNYSEYRPFFAEGGGFLTTLPNFSVNGAPNQMFYTPSLSVLDSGLKVEGTAGHNSIGLLQANGDGYDDQAFGYGYSKSDGSLGVYAQGVDAHHPGVVDKSVGIGATYKDFRDGLQPLISYQQETGTQVSSVTLARQLFVGQLYNYGKIQSGLFYHDVGPQAAPLDGYTYINDIRGPQAYVQYNGVGSGHSNIKSYQLGLVADRYVDRSGAAHEADTFEYGTLTFNDLIAVTLGANASELRTYGTSFPAYTRTQYVPFNADSATITYRNGTPSSSSASYATGPFAVACPITIVHPLPCDDATNGYAGAFTQQLDLTTTRALSNGISATIEYAGTIERPSIGSLDSQWLRRAAITRAFGNEGELALSLRQINGTGGFSLPGTNLALSYHQRFANQSQLFLEYGSPGAFVTLQRFILKYVYHFGKGGVGT